MEINVTKFVLNDEESMMDYSANVMELGRNVGKITWENCLENCEEYNFLDTEEKLQECRDHFAEYGAWTRDEIESWTKKELNAIFLQEIAASKRELELCETYQEMLEAFEQGLLSSRLYPTDETMTEWYFCLGM